MVHQINALDIQELNAAEVAAVSGAVAVVALAPAVVWGCRIVGAAVTAYTAYAVGEFMSGWNSVE